MSVTKEEAERVVHENMGLAHWGANRFMWTGIPFEDLLQCALIGMYNAAFKFDPERGAAFSTVAHWYMLHQLNGETARMMSVISVPDNEHKLGVTQYVSSLDSSGGGEGKRWISNVAETDHEMDHKLAGVTRDVEVGLAVLSERERFVVTQRHGLAEAEQALSQERLGEKMGITRQRVDQIEQKAMVKLRYALRAYDCDGPLVRAHSA